MSPAKVGPRKWKDKNGRTFLARACANNDLEAARARLAERVEDLNMEDNAGNTPLQIASLEGFENIVEFLLTKGADVNVRNVDKDTPLIDAVENGHVEVVKMLLRHGANPRMGNAKGDEPYELVHPEDEAFAEIRGLLAGAKDKDAKKTPGIDSTDLQTRDGASSRAASAASPRDSPPIGPRSPPAFGSRRRTGRSESTRNDLLWQANTQENLAKLAGKGDVQGVANILSILEKAETESLIAAAKAGHEEILQLLIAMGKPDADPEPVRSSKLVPGYNTPILAAIGRGHPDVVKLLAYQSGFNPTRRYKDKTYYELAEDRHGDRWEEEHSILKQAYEKFKGKRPGSPRRTRDTERSRPRRRSSSLNSAVRQMPSPATTHKSLPTIASPGEGRKVSDSLSEKSSNNDAVDSAVAIASDVDQKAGLQKKTHRTRRSQSDLPPLPMFEHEPTHKRRRLVTGKEHRSRHTLSASSDQEEDVMIEVKQEDRPHPPLKRSRVSSTPDPPADVKDRKKRRTVLESSPDDVRPRMYPTTTMPPPLPSIEDTGVTSQNAQKANSSDNKETGTASIPPKLESTGSISAGQAPEATPPVIHRDTGDPEVLPDVIDESDDHYSPPPAVEPPAEVVTEDDEKHKAQEESDRRAAEEAARREEQLRVSEEQRKAEEEQKAKDVAAQQARIKAEAEAKQREEELERQQQEEEEKQQRIKQEIEARIQLEQAAEERRRLESLPVVLARTAQMIDKDDPLVRSPNWLSRFLPLYAVKTKQLELAGDMSGAEVEWIPNFQVASLLSKKDLRLLEFTSFEKRPVSAHERRCLWRVARLKLAYDFNDANPQWTIPVSKASEIETTAQEKFMSMEELFWVKLSDFLDQVSNYAHLDLPLPRQTISLKSYDEILGRRLKTGSMQNAHNLPNGIIAHINGENGVT